MSDPIVLLFAGDLQSACVLRWLHRQGLTVHALVINLGQNVDLEEIQRSAAVAGATQSEVVDVRERLIGHFGHTALWGGALGPHGDSVWPSLVYPVVAEAHVAFAQKFKNAQIAHTADWGDEAQACLEVAYKTLAPKLRVFTPLRDVAFAAQFQELRDYLTYAKSEELFYNPQSQEVFFEQESVLGATRWGKHLPREGVVPASYYRTTVAPEAAPPEGVTFTLAFASGKPVSILDSDGNSMAPKDDAVAMMSVLNRLGGQHGVGRADKICVRYRKVSERTLYEAPGLAVLDLARADLELATIAPEVRKLRDILTPCIRDIIASGRWFTPEMQFIEAALKTLRVRASGRVTLRLLCGGAFVVARAFGPQELDNSLGLSK